MNKKRAVILRRLAVKIAASVDQEEHWRKYYRRLKKLP